MLDAEGLRQAVVSGDRDTVRRLAAAALDAGVDAVTILNDGLLPGMDVVGKRFGAKEMYISDVLLAARAMHTGLALIRPALATAEAAGRTKPVVVLGTVKGDMHDIGKNLVGMMLEAGGFTVVDLGTNVSAEKFIQAAREHGAQVVGLSALLTTTMREMRQTLAALRAAEGLGAVRTVIGGAPVTREFADTIGADGWAPDAPTAVMRIREMVSP